MTVFQPWALWSEEAGHSPQIPPHAFVAGLLEKARMKEGERLLDVGAGIGFISIPAAHQFEWPGSVVALEPADDSRRELARLSEGLGVDAIRVAGGEAERLPLGDSTVDAVIMRSVLIYVADKA